MQLILVRHGDPDYPNDTLTPKGRSQAEGLETAFQKIPIDALYASPMGRARDTAEYIARATGKSMVVLDWLHELNGNYTGALWAWNHHGVEAFCQGSDISLANWTEQVPYGKHMAPVAEAFWDTFDRFMHEQGYERQDGRYRVLSSSDKAIAFACHAGVIQTLLSHLLHIPLPVTYSQFAVDPSSRTTLATEEKDGWAVFRMVCLNDMSHAAGIE